MSNFKYDIHYTGSSNGNVASIYYKNLGFLVDIGKPYKYIEPLLYDKHFLIVTHKHGDHIKWATYNKIREHFPHIKVLANAEMNSEFEKRGYPIADVEIFDDMQIAIGDLKVTFIQNHHGDKKGDPENYADNHGFVMEGEGENLLFATDLSTTLEYQIYLDKNSLQIDYLLLESNYRPEVIEFYETSKYHTGFDIFSNGSYRHLPNTEHDFMKTKYLKEGGQFEELHMSETYGSFEGLIKKLNGKITMKEVRAWTLQHTK